MKRAALTILIGSLVLSACDGGTVPLVSPTVESSTPASTWINVNVDDTRSFENATLKYTPPTEKEPAKRTWTIDRGEGALLTFSTRAGAPAAYITGYRITSLKLNGVETVKDPEKIYKYNIYVPSGWSCPERPVTDPLYTKRSCEPEKPTTYVDTGAEVKVGFYMEGGLGDWVSTFDRSVVQTAQLEFLGHAANNQPFVLRTLISSRGNRLGDLLP